MDIDKLSPELAVCGQVLPRDMPQIHALGYRTVICNRPDGEAEEQPLYESVAAAAVASGLRTHYVPVPQTGPEAEQIETLKDIWTGVEKPALFYCRTGGRSRALVKEALGF